MMNVFRSVSLVAVTTAVFSSTLIAHGSDPIHDAFTYQGQLKHNGDPVAGPVNLAFRLYDAQMGGGQVGPEIESFAFDGFDEDGRFTLDLAFGKGVFDGTPLWLEIDVDGTTLEPRQPIMPTPYAVRALNVATVADPALAGTYTNPLQFTNAGNAFSGSFSGSGAALTDLNASNITTGTLGSSLLTGTYGNALTLSNAGNSFTGAFNGSGAGLLNLNASTLASGTVPNARLAGTYSNPITLNNVNNFFAGNGVSLYNLNANTLASGTVPGARLGGTYPNALTLSNVDNAFTGTFTGSGAGLTGLSASNISSGTLGGSLLGGSYTNAVSFSSSGNFFNGLFSGNGADLFNLNASNISSGTLSAPRLPVGGSWNLTSILNIGGALSVNPSTLRVGIGTGVGDATLTVETQEPGLAFRAKSFSNAGDDLVTVGRFDAAAFSTAAPGHGGRLLFGLQTLTGSNTTGGAIDVVWHEIEGTTQHSDMVFSVRPLNVFGPQERMRIKYDGRIGIGTDSPEAMLHVERASSGSTPQLRVHNASLSGYSRVRMTNNEHEQYWDIAAGGTDNYLDFFQSGGGGSIVTLRGDTQRAGVRTINPAFTLHVNGDAGKPGGGSWATASDARLKHNIQPLPPMLDRLLALQGVTFEYRDHEAIHELPGQRIGMIAQDVARVFPDWVDEANDGYLRLTYRGFEAVMVEALRDLREEKDAELAAQAEKIVSQQDEIDAMRRELDELRRMFEQLSK